MRKVVSTISLALALAAAGCSTNLNPGNGQPANTPGVTPTSTPGASSGTTSTSVFDRRASAADAIAVLAADQAYQGRVLGPADPAPVPRTTTAVPVTGQINPIVTSGITTSDTLGTAVGTAPVTTTVGVPAGTVATQTAIAPSMALTAPVSVPALAPVATSPVTVTNANGAAVRVVNSNGGVSVTNTSTNSGKKQ
jgi:hypothetical protein